MKERENLKYFLYNSPTSNKNYLAHVMAYVWRTVQTRILATFSFVFLLSMFDTYMVIMLNITIKYEFMQTFYTFVMKYMKLNSNLSTTKYKMVKHKHLDIFKIWDTHTRINIPNRMLRKLIIRDLLLSLIWYGADHEQK